VQHNDLIEYKLYDEPFVFYDAEHVNQRSINVGKVDMTNLCLLEDGHCMRTQALKLCDKYGKDVASKLNFEYKAGSIDSLLRFVKANNATTLLPYLSVTEFSDDDNRHVREFSAPVPYRSVGLLTHRHFAKKKVVKELQTSIISATRNLIPAISIKGEKLMPLGD
jgi:LysR family hydrogen peroxide-inducible transcriptional activator